MSQEICTPVIVSFVVRMLEASEELVTISSFYLCRTCGVKKKGEFPLKKGRPHTKSTCRGTLPFPEINTLTNKSGFLGTKPRDFFPDKESRKPTFPLRKNHCTKRSELIAKSLDIRGVFSIQRLRCGVFFTPAPISSLRRCPKETTIRTSSLSLALRLFLHFFLHSFTHTVKLQRSKLPAVWV